MEEKGKIVDGDADRRRDDGVSNMRTDGKLRL